MPPKAVSKASPAQHSSASSFLPSVHPIGDNLLKRTDVLFLQQCAVESTFNNCRINSLIKVVIFRIRKRTASFRTFCQPAPVIYWIVGPDTDLGRSSWQACISVRGKIVSGKSTKGKRFVTMNFRDLTCSVLLPLLRGEFELTCLLVRSSRLIPPPSRH